MNGSAVYSVPRSEWNTTSTVPSVRTAIPGADRARSAVYRAPYVPHDPTWIP